jgi:hypothetical protein
MRKIREENEYVDQIQVTLKHKYGCQVQVTLKHKYGRQVQVTLKHKYGNILRQNQLSLNMFSFVPISRFSKILT